MNAEYIDDYESMNDLCEEILKIYPFDGETMAIHAKSKLELGNKDEAMEIYKKAIENKVILFYLPLLFPFLWEVTAANNSFSKYILNNGIGV